MGPTSRIRCRTLFLSDLHLGSHTCDATRLLHFLDHHQAETVVLVGDALDLWSLRRRRPHWPAEHSEVIRHLLGPAHERSRIVLVTGNHDEDLKLLPRFPVAGLRVCRRMVHTTLAGQRFLVVHGDEHDIVMRLAGRLALVADRWKEGVGALRRRTRSCRREPAAESAVPSRLARRLACVDRFERVLSEEARAEGFDGVICGHIHVPADCMIAGVRYLNCGDWVRSCTALVEHWSGEVELVRWPAAAVHQPAARGVDPGSLPAEARHA